MSKIILLLTAFVFFAASFLVLGHASAQTSATITITSPKVGDIWKIGTSQTITWTSSSPDHEIEIELFSGKSAFNIGLTTSSKQSFSWIVQSYLESGDYSISLLNSKALNETPGRRVIEGSVSGIKVISTEVSLRITSPKSGDIIEKGSIFTISWETTGELPIISINLFHYPGSSTEFGSISFIAENISNVGQYKWDVPQTLRTDGEYLIRVLDPSNVFLGDTVPIRPSSSLLSRVGGQPSLAAVQSSQASSESWFSEFFKIVEAKGQVTETPSLLRAKNDGKVYQIINGRKRHVPSAQAFVNLGLNWNDVAEVEQSQVDTYPRFYLARAEGDSKVYYISGSGYKKWIRNIEIFNSYDNKWDDVALVSQKDLDIYPDVNLIRAKGGERVYKLEGSTKRWVKTAEIFNKLGYDWGAILTVNETEFDFYSEGNAIES